MVKILSITPYPFLPARTGGQRAIALFNRYLSKLTEVHCITTINNQNNLAEYVTVPILSASRLRYINALYFFSIRKYIRKNQISHILLEHPYYGWLAIILKYFCNVKFIARSHNIESMRWKTLNKWWWKILWQYERLVQSHADINFFITEDDRQYAIKNYGLNADKCVTITYGTDLKVAPSREERAEARKQLTTQYKIDPSTNILFFNGSFNYPPNKEGLQSIIKSINPLLQKQQDLKYCIIVCGKDIPEELDQQNIPNMYFAGFVDDISTYFKGADVFINPVLNGGGIKTKLVEALAYDLNSVSTENGAIGVPPEICNHKLYISTDGNWQGFTADILKAITLKNNVGEEYFNFFYWGNIAQKAIKAL